MAYNPINVGSIPSDRRYTYLIEKISGGIGSASENSNDNFAAELCNMYCENGKLISRGGFGTAGGILSGKYHGRLREDFFGNTLFHCGSTVYRYDGTIYATAENVPDEESVFLRMNACAYIYFKSGKIYEIKSDFSCVEKEPYEPLIIENSDRSMSEYDTCEPLNMLTKRVRCSYTIDDTGIAGTIFGVPYDIDENEPLEMYVDGNAVTSCKASRTDPKRIIVNGHEADDTKGKEITFSFAVAGEDEKFGEYFGKIYGCSESFCFGGTTKDGTRAFLTANESYPGMYFMSELKEPLYFPDTYQELLGDGSEQVTGTEKRYEKVYFFTERHIYSMSYSFSETEGAVFGISRVNSSIGCTMKNTVQAVDNTLVFAEGTTGVHLLQSTDIFDELNVRHISENLKKDAGYPFAKDGRYFSCDHDRKYYICNGEKLYVWDYGSAPYYDSGDTKKAEERLCWYVFDGMDGCVAMFSQNGVLHLVKEVGENCTCILKYDSDANCDSCYDTDGNEFVSNIGYSYRTKNTDFAKAMMKKRLLYFSFEYEKSFDEKTRIRLNFFGNENEFYTTAPEVYSPSGRIRIKVPPYYAEKYAVSFTFDRGGVGISQLAFEWCPYERVKFDL